MPRNPRNNLLTAGALGLAAGAVGGPLAGAIVGSGALGYFGSQSAADTAAEGSAAALAESGRQFNQIRADNLPFLQAATGTPIYETLNIDDPRAQEYLQQQTDVTGKTQKIGADGSVRVQTGTTGGALNQFLEQYNQAPTFNFDPSGIANDPFYQQQQQLGQQSLDRINSLNGRLGAGSRVLDEVNLQNNLLGDYYNRELQQYGLDLDNFNSRINRLAGIVDVGRGAGGTLAQAGAYQGATAANLIQQGANARASGIIGGANAISGGINNFMALSALNQGSPTTYTTDYSMPMTSQSWNPYSGAPTQVNNY